MVFGRMIGWLCLGLALIALGHEALASLQAGAWQPTGLDQVWVGLAPDGFAAAQAAIQDHLHPWVWDPLIAVLLTIPAWLIAGGIGFGLIIGFRRRRRLIFG